MVSAANGETWDSSYALAGLLTYQRAVCAAFSLTFYDFFLNLDVEIRLIWVQDVSLTSIVYALLRVLGLLWIIVNLALTLDLVALSDKSCYALISLTTVLAYVLMVLLQSMMLLRVYSLFPRSRKVLLFLLATFAVAEGVTAVLISMSIATAQTFVHTGSAQLLGHAVCSNPAPAPSEPTRLRPQWTYPLGTALLLFLETVIIAFVLAYAYMNTTASFWRSPIRSSSSLLVIIVRDNLVYFLIAFAAILVNTVAPFIRPSPGSQIITPILESIMMTMIGPWLIVSLRRHMDVENDRELEPCPALSTNIELSGA